MGYVEAMDEAKTLERISDCVGRAMALESLVCASAEDYETAERVEKSLEPKLLDTTRWL